MDRSRLGELELQLRHRHGHDWTPMDRQPLHHGAAEHDPERGWLRGRIFRCRTCDEEILVEVPEGDPDRH